MTTANLRFDIDALRAEFPILEREVNGHPLVYLDNGATSQKPLPVLEAIDRYWTTQNANVHRGVHTLSQVATQAYDGTRETVRAFLGAGESDEIIFTKGCTEGINLVAHGLKLSSGDRILVSTMEHHSNIVPWQLAAEKVGATVEPIPISDAGEIDLEAYESLLKGGRVKMVGIVHVSNSLGTVNPVKQMAVMAHAYGAQILIDGAQAGPHRRIDVRDLDADFYTLSCHKMYAPTGVGVLYGKRALLEAMPPYQGGGDMIRRVSFEKTTYAPIPAKFEAGTPNIAGVVGLDAAIKFISDFGFSISDLEIEERPGEEIEQGLDLAFGALEAREAELTAYATERLLAVDGLRLTGTAKDKAGVLSFVLDFAHPHDIGTILDGEGVAVRTGHHCCQPLMKRLGVPATTRASLAMYNTEGEIDVLIRGLERVREVLA
jgi:cysteine desulfurase/selenocysteine lyase